jgi:hypothetical protein
VSLSRAIIVLAKKEISFSLHRLECLIVLSLHASLPCLLDVREVVIEL